MSFADPKSYWPKTLAARPTKGFTQVQHKPVVKENITVSLLS
jgi:hypothetical protein